jgi:hypothetical protein
MVSSGITDQWTSVQPLPFSQRRPIKHCWPASSWSGVQMYDPSSAIIPPQVSPWLREIIARSEMSRQPMVSGGSRNRAALDVG